MANWDSYTQKAAPEDDDTLMIKDTADEVNMRTPFSGVWTWIKGKIDGNYKPQVYHSANGDASAGYYVKICTINIVGTYADRPLYFKISQRNSSPSNVYVLFSNDNSTDPTIESFIADGDSNVYLYKSGTSTWELYVQQIRDAYAIFVDNYVNNSEERITVTWENESVSSLPVGYIGSGATAMQEQINSAVSTAEAAESAANSAQSTADAAQTAANNAKSAADTAQTAAETAQATAEAANTLADQAYAIGEAAQSTAGNANSTASSAYSLANVIKQSGDTMTAVGNYAGYITTDGTSLRFSIPCVFASSVSSAYASTNWTMYVRSDGGYEVGSSSSATTIQASNISLTLRGHHIDVAITFSTARTNNIAVGIAVASGTIGFE